MNADTPTTFPNERTELFRELSQSAQEVRLLADVLDAMTESTDIVDIVRELQYGIKNVLPATSWSNITLSLLDESGQSARLYEVRGEAVSRYWSNVRSGALAAGRDLGVHVDVVMGDAVSQIAALGEMIKDRPSGIAVAPIDAAGMEPNIAAARQVGIPIIAFDTPPVPGSASIAYVGADNHAAGRLAGEALRRLLPDGGVVGASMDLSLAENGMERVMGLEDGLGDASIRVLPPHEEHFNPQLGRRLASETLQEHPDLAGAFGVSGANGPSWGVAAVKAGRAGQFKIVCFDLITDTITMLQQGVIHAVIAQREYDMGYRAVELLCHMAIDGVETIVSRLPESRTINTGVDVVTLERTDWSVALADYLRRSSRVSPDLSLRERVAAQAQPISIIVLGMAEVGDSGVVERSARLEPQGLIGQVVARGHSVVTSDDTGDAKTLVGVPLIIHGSVLGAITLASPTPHACQAADLALIERIAGVMAIVIENARLFRQLERRAHEIEDSYRRQEAMLQTISELSSPVVPVARDILVVPMIGSVDTQRATQFVETLLVAVGEHHAKVVIIDITGVTVVDTSVAHHILQAAQAAQLLGAEVVLVGITPAVAQTIVQLGVQLPGIVTRADLESGFAYALSRTGGRVLYD